MSVARSNLARTAVIAAVALVAILVAGPVLTGWRPTPGVSAAPTNAGTGSAQGITVDGIGRVTLTPDLATVSVGVQTQASTAAQAQSQASAAMAKIIAAVKGQGIADADMTSQWVSLSPQYGQYGPGGSPAKLTGYQASQSLEVKVRQLAKSGPVIDAAVSAGANVVGGISFSLSDSTAATAQARTAAVADAKKRAQALADAAGVQIGNVISISETSSPSPTPIAYDKAMAASGAFAPTPIQPGTTEIEVDVEVTFEIG